MQQVESDCNKLWSEPQSENDLLGSNQTALKKVDFFLGEYAKFNLQFAKDVSKARFPLKNCLIVKGPPGCGKNQAIHVLCKKYDMVPKVVNLALHARDKTFVDQKLAEILSGCTIGTCLVLKDLNALSTGSKPSPKQKMMDFLTSCGMAANWQVARKLRNLNAPGLASAVQAQCDQIIAAHKKLTYKGRESTVKSTAPPAVKKKSGTKRFNSNTKQRGVSSKKATTLDQVYHHHYPFTSHVPIILIADDHQHHIVFSDLRKLASGGSGSLYHNFYVQPDAEKSAEIAENQLQSMRSGGGIEQVQFYRPEPTHIKDRMVSILRQCGVQISKPKFGESFLLDEISVCAAGDMRRAAYMLDIGLHRVFVNCEKRLAKLKQKNDPGSNTVKPNNISSVVDKANFSLVLSRKLIAPVLTNSMSMQPDNFTVVSFLVHRCSKLDMALQHVARPIASGVAQTIYESVFKVLPFHLPDASQSEKRKRRKVRETNRMASTPRSTKNSKKQFSVESIEQRLYARVRQNFMLAKQDSVMFEENNRNEFKHTNTRDLCLDTTPEQDQLCLKIVSQMLGTKSQHDSTQHQQSVHDRAAENLTRVNFEETFSWSDFLSQEFCYRRSPTLQQIGHDNCIGWAFMCYQSAQQTMAYKFIQSCATLLPSEKLSFDHSEHEKVPTSVKQTVSWGQLHSRLLCTSSASVKKNLAAAAVARSGTKRKPNQRQCNQRLDFCTCAWLSTPSLKGCRGVCLQWEKSTIQERDLYDIKRNAFCQTSCDIYFYYNSYIGSVTQVRPRINMLVNQKRQQRN